MQETMERFIRDYEKPAFYGWAIEYNGELIGTIGAYDYDSETNQIETAYGKWWEYWRSYWKRRGTTDVYPKDYVCEVSIPDGKD